MGYVIELGGKRIYHAGDTDLITEMSELGDIDIAFLPIGGTFTMDIDEAIDATKIISPKTVIAMHPLKASPQKFIEKVSNLASVNAVYLEPGQVFSTT